MNMRYSIIAITLGLSSLAILPSLIQQNADASTGGCVCRDPRCLDCMPDSQGVPAADPAGVLGI